MEKQATREAYGQALEALGAANENVVVLDADLSKSTKTNLFQKKFPERFFDMGIAEQNMMGVAAGFAATGKVPFASTFAVFATGRAYDQIRNTICYPQLTSIDNSLHETGRMAAKQMIRLLNHESDVEKTICLPCRLVLRDTTPPML